MDRRALVERGEIAETADGKYRVKSIDRNGIITPPISAMATGESAYNAGDRVYFFMFDDGHGGIIGKLEG